MRRSVLWLAAAALVLGCSGEGPMGPAGAVGPQGPSGPQGDRGPAGITVVSATATIVSIGGGQYGAVVTFPGVTLAQAVVGCWARDPSSTVWFKVAFDFSGTGLDSCLAQDTQAGLQVSFITEKDHLWLGNIFMATVAYSTP